MQSSFFAIVFSLFSLASHPFHVSVCEIEYNKTNQSLEIIHKFFLDDMEAAINNRYAMNMDLLSDPDQNEVDRMMKIYLAENFKLSNNNQSLSWNYLGSEIEEDAIRCYLEITNIKQISNLKITNSSLFETFDDQQNMIHFYFGDNTKSLLLSESESSGTIRLEN